METLRELAQMDADQLRDLSATLLSQLADRDAQLAKRDAEMRATIEANRRIFKTMANPPARQVPDGSATAKIKRSKRVIA